MNNIISEIKVSNNIVLLCHNNPDGDAVGSTIAMYILLKRLGKEVDIILDTLPKRFSEPEKCCPTNRTIGSLLSK